ncbi:ATP-binding protein [Natronomonas gomsonensis]|uniref:ATP-binding protein n=1 Tax=Natronomonas gomsonensis TaxID=1046043 RepID=UPI0020CA3DCE|nr:ATP-binding protein [Natronomonas gomsonensis]MCY4730463.1 ATP-binding protein [Natronomonas gomsonensis]
MSLSSESHYTKQFKQAVDEAHEADSSEERVKKLLKAKKYLQKVSEEIEDERASELEYMSDSFDDIAKNEVNNGNGRKERRGKKEMNGQMDGSEFFQEPPDLDLDDVGGMTDLKKLLQHNVIHQFEDSEYREMLGVSPTNGILLHGPPGTGKTYISKALAGELGYSYAKIRGSDLISSYVGETGKNVADLFDEALQMQPCVIFIDEIDSIASNRQSLERDGQAYSNAVSEMIQSIQEVQGEDIVVIAATNLLDNVDGAIRRSGRFDQKIEVPPPEPDAREEILQIHLGNRTTAEDVDTHRLAELTEEFSASDLEKIVEEAAQTAHIESVEQDELQPVSQRHLRETVQDTEPSLKHWES